MNNQDIKRIKKKNELENTNHHHPNKNNIYENEQNLMENNNNDNKYTNLISMTTKNDKVTTISIKESSKESRIDNDKQIKTLRIAYASNIGGTGPNLVLQGIMDEYYPNLNDLSFARRNYSSLAKLAILKILLFA